MILCTCPSWRNASVGAVQALGILGRVLSRSAVLLLSDSILYIQYVHSFKY